MPGTAISSSKLTCQRARSQWMPKFSSGIKLGTLLSACLIGSDLFSSTFWEASEVHSLTPFLKLFYQYLWFKWKEFSHSESTSQGCLGCLLAWLVLVPICVTCWLLGDHSILTGGRCMACQCPGGYSPSRHTGWK